MKKYLITGGAGFYGSILKKELLNEEMLLKSYKYYHENRKEIESRSNVSAHNKNAKMGVIRLLKWMM